MAQQLIHDICNCQYFLQNNHHECERILSVQNQLNGANLHARHLPEPWAGDIINSPVLFISSNPSLNRFEIYPDSTWPEGIIRDFFVNRFKNRGEKYSWVWKNKVLLINGNRSHYVRYWSSIMNRAKELFQRNVIPGIDYSITELVHCKSIEETGVEEALNTCSGFYIDRILKLSKAVVIVKIGRFVREYYEQENLIGDRLSLQIPHPNAWGFHTFEHHYIDNPQLLVEAQTILQNVNFNNDLTDYNLPEENEVIGFIEERINQF